MATKWATQTALYNMYIDHKYIMHLAAPHAILFARADTIQTAIQGPVVQSVVSLTSSLRVISLTTLADSTYNILIFFAEKMWVAFAKATHIFSAKNFSIFAYHLM